MSQSHQRRTYRHNLGCCVCGAKSSSSRFTSSQRYEMYFDKCFETGCDDRSGQICNACVLLVKRHKRALPAILSWPHVLDLRVGPGLKSLRKVKSQDLGLEQNSEDRKLMQTLIRRNRKKRQLAIERCAVDKASSAIDEDDSTNDDDQQSVHIKRDFGGRHELFKIGRRPKPFFDLHTFIDHTYWTRVSVCCGAVYKGRFGEILFDMALYHPCSLHKYETFPPTCLYLRSNKPSTESNTLEMTTNSDKNVVEAPVKEEIKMEVCDEAIITPSLKHAMPSRMTRSLRHEAALKHSNIALRFNNVSRNGFDIQDELAMDLSQPIHTDRSPIKHSTRISVAAV